MMLNLDNLEVQGIALHYNVINLGFQFRLMIFPLAKLQITLAVRQYHDILELEQEIKLQKEVTTST